MAGIKKTRVYSKKVVQVGTLLVGFICSVICSLVMVAVVVTVAATATAGVHVTHLVTLANDRNRMMTTHLYVSVCATRCVEF